MDTQININTLYSHFEISHSNLVNSEYKSIFESFGENFSARQLCDALIDEFWTSESIPEKDREYDANCLKSSVFAVACEFTNKLKTREMKNYTKNRAGIIASKDSPNGKSIDIISLRDIIEWMISQ